MWRGGPPKRRHLYPLQVGEAWMTSSTPYTFLTYCTIPPLSLSPQLSLPTLFLSGPQTQSVSFFLSCAPSAFSGFFISYTSPPPTLPRAHSSLLLMCCFPVEFGSLTVYNSAMQMFASSAVVLCRETQCDMKRSSFTKQQSQCFMDFINPVL